mgnify:CR=1 FL=1
MKQVKEKNLADFLKKKKNWLRKRRECAEKRGIKYCDECKSWPCELLKRSVLAPVDLREFEEFMRKVK